ncbi:MAG: PAS domain-containing protein [Clostridia bacterium]|nr:PAS domain-containing protein [Clostridia bacterium]
MSLVAVAEFVSIAFVGASLIGLIGRKGATGCLKWLRWSMAALMIYMFIDGLSYIGTDLNFPFAVRYVVELLAYSTGSIVIIFLTKYTEAYIKRKAVLKQWVMLLPVGLLSVIMVLKACEFIAGNIVVFKGGVIVADNGLPIYLRVIEFAAIIYPLIIACHYRKSIGYKAVIILGIYYIAPIMAFVVSIFAKEDITAVFASVSIILVATLLQRDENQASIEANATLSDKNLLLEKEQKITNTIHEIIHSGKWTVRVDKDDIVINADVSEELLSVVDNNIKTDGYSWMDIVHPEDKNAVKRAFEATIKDHSSKTLYDVNYRMADRDGKYRWYHSAGQIKRDRDGNGEFFGIQLDINDQVEEQQKRFLGAVPLSSDVLKKAYIGLWAFELDEGQPPRMYADEAMLKLLGLKEQLSPEDTYHAWYDNIDEGSYGLVADAVDKMTAGVHSEVQYPWHNPDGTTMIVRCGGVRNPEYKKGIRIEGTHQDVSAMVHYDIKDKQAADDLISGFTQEYEAVILVNLNNGTSKVIKDVYNIIHSLDDSKHFSSILRFFVDNYVHGDDKSKFVDALYSVDSLSEYIQEGNPISFEYRSSFGEEYIWHKCMFNRVNKDTVLAGLANCDDEVLIRNVNTKLMEDYDTIMFVNLDTDIIRPIRITDVLENSEFHDISVYSEHIRMFAEVVGPQYKQDWINFANVDYMKEYMRKEDHREYIYELPITKRAMRRLTVDVLERADGEASTLLLSFVGIDDYRAQALQNQRKIEEQGAFTSFFLRPYISAYYVGFDDMSCQIYKKTAENGIDSYSDTNYLDFFNEYIDRKVHPDDRDEFKKLLEPSRMREMLAEQSEFFYLFRSFADNPERRIRFQVIRGADENHAAFGLRDVTEEWRQTQNQHALADGLSREYHTIWLLDGSNNHDMHLYCANEDPIYESEAKLIDGMNGYDEGIAKYIREHVFGEDKKRVIHETLFSTIENETPETGNYVVTYRRCIAQHKEYDYHQMCFVRAVAADGTVNYILAFRDADKMIRNQIAQKEKMNQVLDLANQQRRINAFGDRVNVAGWSVSVDDMNDINEVYWSDEMRRMLGFEMSEEDFPNTLGSWVNILHSSDKERVMNYLRDCLRSRNSDEFEFDAEYRAQRKSGEYSWYRSVGRMETDNDGMRKVYGIIYNISAEKELEQQRRQLERLEAMFELSDREQMTYINDLANDMRTPINAIANYGQLASNAGDREAQVDTYLNKINRVSEYMQALLDDIANKSRESDESDKSASESATAQEASLADILHTIRSIIIADVRRKNLNFIVEAANINDECIVCDKFGLTHVLLNCLTDSVKYTPVGGTITLRITEKGPASSGYATFEFCVTDNGLAMSNTIDSSIGRASSVSKENINKLNGTLNIDSEPEEGTKVTMTFDFKLQDVSVPQIQIPELSECRVLIFDKNTDACLDLCDIFDESGMHSEWCTSSDVAVSLIETSMKKDDAFKLVVIDCCDSETDCVETVKAVRNAVGKDVSIIAITAYDCPDTEEKVAAAGATAFLSKPVFRSELAKVLKACI